MGKKLSEYTHIPPILVRAGLILVLVASWFGVYSSVTWIFHQVHESLGFGLAQVVVAFLVILISFLFLLGFSAGFGADYVVRQRKIRSLSIYHLTNKNSILKSLWDFILPLDGLEGLIHTNEPHPADIEVLLNRPKRRGRPPTHSLGRWTRVVMAWENRDPLRNPMTLAEFLSQEFGTYADGSPCMSENSYYDWRKRVFDDLHKKKS